MHIPGNVCVGPHVSFDSRLARTTAALSIGQKAPHAFKASKAVFPIDVV
jgi:hypothetical protein